jgi:hypothetical protein
MLRAKNNYSLDAGEKDILVKTGMPPIFAQFLKEKSVSLGVAFAIRATSPFQRYLMPAAPKPSSVKAKTGNWSFTKGVISVDPALGKTEKIDGKWQLIPRTSHDFPKKNSGILSEVIHRLSLQEVLYSLNSGEYTLVGTENDIHESGFLVVKAKFKFPYDTEIVFRINFNEKKSRLEKQFPIDVTKLLIDIPVKESQPKWWNESWGKFTLCLDNYYPAQYMSANDSDFKDILAYGVNDGTGQVLPITGDQDLLWISVPSNKHDQLLKDFEEVFNSFDENDLAKLYKARIDLHIRMGGKPEDAVEAIHNHSLAGLGNVTAYESYVIDEVNTAFDTCGIRHLRKLIQHAAENHTPEIPGHLDANMIHVWRGKISMTHNENEIIKFVMQQDYPNENIVNVHPGWDMAKWYTVIDTQIHLKQPVPAATLEEYKKHRGKVKPNALFGLTSWIKKEKPDETENE